MFFKYASKVAVLLFSELLKNGFLFNSLVSSCDFLQDLRLFPTNSDSKFSGFVLRTWKTLFVTIHKTHLNMKIQKLFRYICTCLKKIVPEELKCIAFPDIRYTSCCIIVSELVTKRCKKLYHGNNLVKRVIFSMGQTAKQVGSGWVYKYLTSLL